MKALREELYEIIFKSDTVKGKMFDVGLIITIIISLIIIMLDSVASLKSLYGKWFIVLEWWFTIIFTIEYILRIYSSKDRKKYIFSFFGIIDLLSIAPSYLGIFFPEILYLISIRAVRIIRIFRVLKLSQYVNEANHLTKALELSQKKISVFLATVLLLITILGSIIYVVEGEKNGFTSIPVSMYWAVVTLTTVGYGDMSPKTALGQFISSIVMLIGYSIIAIPTGIVTVSISEAMKQNLANITCKNCSKDTHEKEASYCCRCGHNLY